jgi:hypothetical protein
MRKYLLPALTVLLLMIGMIASLKAAGRSWFAPDNSLLLWYGDPNGSGTSQHITDPYSFTHFLHGVMFFWIISLAGKRLAPAWQFSTAVAFEAVWELVENSEAVIRRYREATFALGYYGDSIINSLSDICFCSLGFLVAARLGGKKSLLLFAAIELFLLLWIKDSLLVNIIMLVYPVEAIKAWQGAPLN